MKRNEFIKKISLATVLLSDGSILPVLGKEMSLKSPKMRFLVASDGHYGQSKTDYVNYYENFVANANAQHQISKLDFCVINGDIVHDDIQLMPEAKAILDKLKVPYFVTQGNHDHATEEDWQKVWNVPLNYSYEKKESAFLFGTTSNEKGEYLSPNVAWFSEQLERFKAKKNIFIFVHITPVKWTNNGVDAVEFQALMQKYPNIRAVFNGHDHDQEGVKQKNGTSYIFDSHFGGNWGTSYRGFRIVELNQDNSVLTYLLNPTEKVNENKL